MSVLLLVLVVINGVVFVVNGYNLYRSRKLRMQAQSILDDALRLRNKYARMVGRLTDDNE